MKKWFFLITLLASCGADERTSSFSRPYLYKSHALIKTFSVGHAHTCSILLDGTLKCWGKNNHGQLGSGPPLTPHKTPVSISLGMRAKEVSTGNGHTCTILDDDSLKCWGHNQFGEVGNGDLEKQPLPVSINLGEERKAKSVSAGNGHTCAILDDDSIKCWGANDYGQMGVGTNTPTQTTPIDVPLGTEKLPKSAKMISAGGHHTCAILSDHSLSCWGHNQNGQIGDSSTDNRNLPVTINLGENLTALAVSAGQDHTCALLNDRSLKCWGLNDSGQLGDGTSTPRATPVPVNLPAGARSTGTLSLGQRHSCVLLTNGTPRCWGHNQHRQLGDGTTDPQSLPITPQLSFGTIARSIGSGSQHTCAILDNDSLICWGDNTDGRLGDGTDQPSNVPVLVKL